MTAGRSLRLVYTVTEAAELLGISRSTAYELVATGALSTIQLGRRRVITRPTLSDLLGVEPPLPHELDTLRQSAPTWEPPPIRPATDALTPRRRTPTDAAQTALPFRAS